MWKSHALISHKTAQKRHWDKAEEDDEEDCTTNHSLRLWTETMLKERTTV